jgi:hypothetical protein
MMHHAPTEDRPVAIFFGEATSSRLYLFGVTRLELPQNSITVDELKHIV